MFGISSQKERNELLVFIMAISLLKLILIFFSQTTDPDAVVRVIQSDEWKNSPHWIGNNVWGPFNYYLNGFGLAIYNDLVITPKLINVILSILTILPLYGWLRVNFNHRVTLLAVSIFVLSPLVLRNSLMAMTETPYLFFVVSSLFCLTKFFEKRKVRDLIFSSLFITIAAGFRYEAWALMFVLAVILLLRKRIRVGVLFAIIAGLFPLIWLVSNQVYTGDFLWSLKGNNQWTLEVMKTNENVSMEGWLRRGWFIPFMFFIGGGPIFLVLFFKGLMDRRFGIWLIPFGFVFLLLMYKSLNGTLLHHPRFALTLLLLSIPFVAVGVKWILVKARGNLILAIGFVLMIGGSFIYNVDRIEPVPLLKDQNSLACLDQIQRMEGDRVMVFVDFLGWEETYYYALQLKNSGHSVQIVGGYDQYNDVELKYREFAKSNLNKWVISDALLIENPTRCLLIDKEYLVKRTEEIILLNRQ